MDKKTEALKLAQFALEDWAGGTQRLNAITAIREALADHIVDANKMAEQPAQQDTIVLTDIEILNCFQQRSKDKTKERRLIAEQIIKTVLEKLQ